MSVVAEQTDTDLSSLIRKASPQARRAAMHTLIAEFLEETKYLPQPILTATGELVGLFVPHYRHKPTAPPKLTPAQEAEIDRRLNTLDNSVSPEEFIKLLDQEHARLSQQQ